MNIYLENANLLKNNRRLNRCCAKFGVSDPVHFHLICSGSVSPLHLYLLTSGNKSIATLTLHIPVKHLTGALIRMINSSALLSCVVLVDAPLKKRQWKRICRLGGIIRIVDSCGEENLRLYRENRNVTWEAGEENTIRLADIYHLTTSRKAIYQCHYSSCLGKTLFIAKDGTVSFCPRHPQESILGTVDKLDDLFEAEIFYKTLLRTVEKRRDCKEHGPHFEKCKGGCPFENDCDAFRGAYTEALRERDRIIAREEELSKLPLYKELAVLRHLCDVSKET